jgi:hypothetical protein
MGSPRRASGNLGYPVFLRVSALGRTGETPQGDGERIAARSPYSKKRWCELPLLPNQRERGEMCRAPRKIFLRHKSRNAGASPRFPRRATLLRGNATQLHDQALQTLAMGV